MGLVTVYRRDAKHVLQSSAACTSGSARRCRRSSGSASASTRAVGALSALEIADTVTVRDVVAVLQPAELLSGSPTRSTGRSGGAGRGRPPAAAAARGGARRRRARAAPRRARLPAVPTTGAPRRAGDGPGAAPTAGVAGRRRRPGLEPRGHVRRSARLVDRRAARRPAGGGGARAGAGARRSRRCRSNRAATGCCTACPGSPTPSSTGSSSTSPACSGSCGRRWATSRRSTAWARPAPGR